ncbi:MAG: DUF2147 domain-containing protein [Paracoccaceae bacterium]
MKRLIIIAALLLPGMAGADVVSGVFQTQPGDSGGFLHVKMAACANDATLTCGTILRAYHADNSAHTDYEHLGKPIVWDMQDQGDGHWGDGKIWAPDRDKTYNSKMQMQGNLLTVKGCVAFICRGQTWQRFE